MLCDQNYGIVDVVMFSFHLISTALQQIEKRILHTYCSSSKFGIKSMKKLIDRMIDLTFD
jgi:hypothetical protein